MYTNWDVGAQCMELTVYQEKVILNLILEKGYSDKGCFGNFSPSSQMLGWYLQV
jgi:hypothetical protein